MKFEPPCINVGVNRNHIFVKIMTIYLRRNDMITVKKAILLWIVDGLHDALKNTKIYLLLQRSTLLLNLKSSFKALPVAY